MPSVLAWRQNLGEKERAKSFGPNEASLLCRSRSSLEQQLLLLRRTQTHVLGQETQWKPTSIPVALMTMTTLITMNFVNSNRR